MKHVLNLAGSDHEFWLMRHDESYRLSTADGSLSVAMEPLGRDRYRLICGGSASVIALASDGDRVFIHLDGASYEARYHDPVSRYADEGAGPAAHAAIAPMPGTVIALPVILGERVAAGDVLVVIESMKLETALKASHDGIIMAVHVALGQTFERDAVLVSLSPVGED